MAQNFSGDVPNELVSIAEALLDVATLLAAGLVATNKSDSLSDLALRVDAKSAERGRVMVRTALEKTLSTRGESSSTILQEMIAALHRSPEEPGPWLRLIRREDDA